MSIFITVLSLLGLAGGAKYSYKQGVRQKMNSINNNPAHALPNKYSPGYYDFKKEYAEWESRKKIYDSYCSEERKIWENKLDELVKYCGDYCVVEEEFSRYKIHLTGLNLGYIFDKYHNIKNLPLITKIKVSISNKANETIPPSELDWKKGFGNPDQRLKFRNIKLRDFNGEEIKNLDIRSVLIEDKNGEYSKTLGEFEREAIIETQKLRQFYERAGFKFPKFPEEYSAYEKWINSANTDYTRFNK